VYVVEPSYTLLFVLYVIHGLVVQYVKYSEEDQFLQRIKNPQLLMVMRGLAWGKNWNSAFFHYKLCIAVLYLSYMKCTI
jgi:hypothetical protein